MYITSQVHPGPLTAAAIKYLPIPLQTQIWSIYYNIRQQITTTWNMCVIPLYIMTEEEIDLSSWFHAEWLYWNLKLSFAGVHNNFYKIVKIRSCIIIFPYNNKSYLKKKRHPCPISVRNKIVEISNLKSLL